MSIIDKKRQSDQKCTKQALNNNSYDEVKQACNIKNAATTMSSLMMSCSVCKFYSTVTKLLYVILIHSACFHFAA